MWPFTLSGRLSIVALVSRYLTNWLIERRLILRRITALIIGPADPMMLCGISIPFEMLSPIRGQITYVLLTRSPLEYPCGPFRSTCMFKTRRQR